MKKLVLSVLVLLTFALFSFSSPAWAGDAVKGKAVFKANCAACHAKGRNTVNPQKTLKKEDLEKYGKYSEEAIIKQVTNGKAAMPAFGGRLKSAQIENVAAYVLERADEGWKRKKRK